MIDACVLTTLIEILFPQETVFNCFGVAVTFLQWKVPKTGLCFEAVQRNGKWVVLLHLWQVPMGMDILLPVLTVCMILWNKL